MTHPLTPTQQETRVNDAREAAANLAMMVKSADAFKEAAWKIVPCGQYGGLGRDIIEDVRALLAERTKIEGLLRTARAWLGRLDSGNEIDDDTIAKLILAIDAEIALPPPPESPQPQELPPPRLPPREEP